MKYAKIAFYVSRFEDEEIQTPPSLQYLAGYLLEHNLINEESFIFADSLDEILAFEPDLLCIGSVSQTYFDAEYTAQSVKKKLPKSFTIIGGYHISALPQDLSCAFDIGVIGEGEITLYELVKLFYNNELSNIAALQNINGICYRDSDGILYTTERRALIKNIDTQPRPFRRVKPNQDNMYLFSARGCPYKCIYCASQSFWEFYRPHSAQYIVEEILRIYKQFNITTIRFVDDLFIAPKKRLREIYLLLKEHNLIGKLTFTGFVRINIIDEEVIQILKEMKFKQIRFGMETASQRLLQTIKHKPPTTEQIERVIDLCKKYHLKVCGSLMFGIPSETIADIQITVDFLRKHINDFQIEGFYLMQPVPGTQLWDDMLEQKILVRENFDISSMIIDLSQPNFNWNKVLYLNNKHIPLQTFRNIIDELREEFMTSQKEIHEDFTILNKLKHNTILLYGTGTIAQKIYPFFTNKKLTVCTTGYTDNTFFDHEVHSIETLQNNSYDALFITAQKDSVDIYENRVKKTLNLHNTSVFIPYFYYIDEKLYRGWKQIED